MSTMEDLRSAVGSNYLIVENIVRFCDLETKKSCCLVNSMWQTQTLKHVWFSAGTCDRNADRDATYVALLDKPLNPFPNIKIHHVVRPQLLDYFGSSLNSLYLCRVKFPTISDMENVLFNNFPNMKVLTLAAVGVNEQEKCEQSPGGAVQELTPARAQLESLNVYTGDDDDWENGEQSGVLLLGLNILFQKFNKIKALDFEVDCHVPNTDVFAALIQANLAPAKLQFHSFFDGFDSIAEYLSTYGDRLLHVKGVINQGEGDMRRLKNINVGSWLSVRMLGADWNTFGRGTFENLRRLEIQVNEFESFDFLRRMPVLKEIEIYNWPMTALGDSRRVTMVTARERNPPCKTVTKLDTWTEIKSYGELYFHVFPNVTQLNLCCYGHQIPEVVNNWKMLTKLHLAVNWDSEVPRNDVVTRNVMNLQSLEFFRLNGPELTFGDAEGEEFLFHPKLTYLYLCKISMSPLMVRLLKRKMVEFKFAYWNGVDQKSRDLPTF